MFANPVGPSSNASALKCPFLFYFRHSSWADFCKKASAPHFCRPLLSWFVRVHPFVCTLVAEAHLLYKLISLCRTTAMREPEQMWDRHHCIKKILKKIKAACFTFRICIWWVASSPSLSDEAEEWRFSRLPSTHHFDEISQIQKRMFQNY